jgi:hypothetical protein
MFEGTHQRLYSESSLTLKEERVNLSFSWVSVLFLNSWRVSVVPYYLWLLTLQLFKNSTDTLKDTLKEWRFNLSFSRVSMLFLNSWRVSLVPCDATTQPPAIQKQHWHSREDWTSTLWVWVSFHNTAVSHFPQTFLTNPSRLKIYLKYAKFQLWSQKLW